MGNRGEPENPVVWKAVLQLKLDSFFRVFNVYNHFYITIKDVDTQLQQYKAGFCSRIYAVGLHLNCKHRDDSYWEAPFLRAGRNKVVNILNKKPVSSIFLQFYFLFNFTY